MSKLFIRLCLTLLFLERTRKFIPRPTMTYQDFSITTVSKPLSEGLIVMPIICRRVAIIQYCDSCHKFRRSVNLKKAGMASRNIVMKKQYTRSDQLCGNLWTSRVWFLIFGWLDLFSRDPTITTSRIFVHGYYSYFS